MIGNDVIDLQLAFQNQRWKSRRYLQKLFSEDEQALILKNEDPQLMLCLLWGMKEAAYKANQRRFDLERKYNPLCFECFLDKTDQKDAIGKVVAGEHTYACSSFLDPEKIHTVSSVESMEFNLDISESASAVMKSNFFIRISELKGLELEKIALKYNRHNVPYLFFESQMIELAFSLSHHGRYSAYVYALKSMP